jgi:predicted small lipoprotein YifL
VRFAVALTMLIFTAGFAALLVASVAESGRFGPLEVISVLIVALLATGAVGALRHPDDD